MKIPTPVAPYTINDVIALIDGGQFLDVDLYTIALASGGVIRLTTASVDITDGVNTWSSRGPHVDIERSKAVAHWKTGLDSDTWVVTFLVPPTDVVTGADFPDRIGNVPWVQAANSGVFDDADVQVDRAYFAVGDLRYPFNGIKAKFRGRLTIFAGAVSITDTATAMVVMTIGDYRERLTIGMPRHSYQAGCRHTLFDVACNNAGSNPRASFKVNGVVGAGSTQAIIVAPALAAPGASGTYVLGTIIMKSGLNTGFQRTVTDWDHVNLPLLWPLPFDVVAGDTFEAYPGCDFQFTTCGKFGLAPNGNQDNFGGQPDIPDPATAL